MTTQLPNPKAQFGVKKPCLSRMPLAVLVPICQIDLAAWERDKRAFSDYVNAAIYYLILYYDFHLDAVPVGGRMVHPVFAVAAVLLRFMHRLLSGVLLDDRRPPVKLDFEACCRMQTDLLAKYAAVEHKAPFLANIAADDSALPALDPAAVPPLASLPMEVLMIVAVAMQEGGIKYGDHNYRCADSRILASTYVDATMRHLVQFFTFHEELDADSKVHHGYKFIASTVVLCDSIYNGANLIDDRPIPSRPRFIDSSAAPATQENKTTTI